MANQAPTKRPLPFKRPARPADPLPPPGSRLTIEEVLPNGDLIVSDGRVQFRIGGISFHPA